MSNVKQRIIDIVNGREPREPKNLVEVLEDEVVVKVAVLPPHIKEYADELKFADERNAYIQKAIDDLTGGEHPALTPHEAISDATGFSGEFFQGGEIPAATNYLVGENPCGCSLPTPTHLAATVEELPTKPYVKFKLHGDGDYLGQPIVPQDVETPEDRLDYLRHMGLKFFPRIVLSQ